MSSLRYRSVVSREARVLAKQGMYTPNVFVAGIDAPSVYPDSVREVLDEAAKLAAAPSEDEPEPCDPAPSAETSEEPLSEPEAEA